MAELKLTQVPVAKTGMLIRRPPAEVFEAFVNPAITTQFWFTKSSGRLDAGQRVKWEWEMYGVSADVDVKHLDAPRRIVVEWPGQQGQTTVEWIFTPHALGTFVSVTDSGFTGSGDEVSAAALDSVGGFSLVLAGAKALLEHKLRLNLVPDRFPPGVEHS